MVEDAKVLLDNSGADLWVVQQDTLGPYAESSTIPDDHGPHVAAVVPDLHGQVGHVRSPFHALHAENRAVDIVGVVPGGPGEPGQPIFLVAGRHIIRSHYEAVADVKTGFRLGQQIVIRRNVYTVVWFTRRTVSSGGDPMVFIPLKDAQEAQFLKDNDAIVRSRQRAAQNPAFNRPIPGLLDAVIASQSTNSNVNAVLVSLAPGHLPNEVAKSIQRWSRYQVYTRAQMEEILIEKLVATSARQIGMFRQQPEHR